MNRRSMNRRGPYRSKECHPYHSTVSIIFVINLGSDAVLEWKNNCFNEFETEVERLTDERTERDQTID